MSGKDDPRLSVPSHRYQPVNWTPDRDVASTRTSARCLVKACPVRFGDYGPDRLCRWHKEDEEIQPHEVKAPPPPGTAARW